MKLDGHIQNLKHLWKDNNISVMSQSIHPVDFFAIVHERFLKAAETAGLIERVYSIAGYTIALQSAGPALLPYITPALDHSVTITDQSPILRVEIEGEDVSSTSR